MYLHIYTSYIRICICIYAHSSSPSSCLKCMPGSITLELFKEAWDLRESKNWRCWVKKFQLLWFQFWNQHFATRKTKTTSFENTKFCQILKICFSIWHSPGVVASSFETNAALPPRLLKKEKGQGSFHGQVTKDDSFETYCFISWVYQKSCYFPTLTAFHSKSWTLKELSAKFVGSSGFSRVPNNFRGWHDTPANRTQRARVLK